MNAQSPVLGLLLLFGSSAAVANAAHCQPTIVNAWIRSAPPAAMMLAGYATVRNPCRHPVAIIDVSGADFGAAMIHETRVVDGVSQMRPAGRLLIPSGKELRFAPGSRHLMLMQPTHQLKSGDRVVLRLKLADGSQVSGSFIVGANPPN